MIEILNVKPGDIFVNSLCFIYGRTTSGEIIECTDSNRYTNKWSIIKRQFKVLVNLSPGRNEIILKTLNSELKIVLFRSLISKSKIIKVLYIVCSDDTGEFQSNNIERNKIQNAVDRINLNIRLLQTFLSEQIYKEFKIRKTFSLNCDINESASACEVYKSKLKLADALLMSSDEIFLHLFNEIKNSDDEKYIAILSFTKYTPGPLEDIFKKTKGYCALAAEWLAVYGTACLFTWAENLQELEQCFYDTTKVDSCFMNDSAFRNTYSDCYSTTLGSLLHEFSHVLDLGHDPDGIMHRGFDNLKSFFTIQSDYCTCYSQIKTSNNLDLVRVSVFKSQNENKVKNETEYMIKKFAFFKSTGQNELVYTQSSSCSLQGLYNDQNFLVKCNCLLNCNYTKANLIILFYNKWLNSQRNKAQENIILNYINESVYEIVSVNELVLYELRTCKRNLTFNFGEPKLTTNNFLTFEKKQEAESRKYLMELNLKNLSLIELDEKRNGCNNLNKHKNSLNMMNYIELFLLDSEGCVLKKKIQIM